MSEFLRGLLMELYILHGEREFEWEWGAGNPGLLDFLGQGLVEYKGASILPIYYLTPKAVEYLQGA